MEYFSLDLKPPCWSPGYDPCPVKSTFLGRNVFHEAFNVQCWFNFLEKKEDISKEGRLREKGRRDRRREGEGKNKNIRVPAKR